MKFVCVKHGTKYDANYVNILFDMVLRNLPEIPLDFTCFTDDPRGLHPQIKTEPLPPMLNGWWNKLWLFKAGVMPENERIIYLDLDTVITSGLDALLDYDGDFAILRDFYRAGGYQSSVMLWKGGFGAHIWDKFEEAGYPDIYGGDQSWIEANVRGADILQDTYPGFFQSYKVSCREGIPRNCHVCIFHGEPRPHEVINGWVPKVWKVGGGSSLELVNVGNTREEQLVANIRHALTLGLDELKQVPAHDGHAVIVGGAPSVKGFVDELRARREDGQKIFCLNNAHHFLVQHGIFADYQVMIDARPENAEFVPVNGLTQGLFASQCDPSVFIAANRKPVLWHDESAKLLLDHDSVLVSGGSTVGLKALCIAYIMGYRKLHIYGMDSSYHGLTHHAYEQRLNEGEKIITVEFNGETFNASPWMVEQASQFMELVPQLTALGCEISVHGEGLIPHIARTAFIPKEEAPEIENIGGMAWPFEGSNKTYQYMMATLPDVDRLMGMVPKKGTAVQAGGNVGLWPLKMAQEFETVHTFEPDAINYKCLLTNCHGKENIHAHRAALGSSEGTTGLVRVNDNHGANHLGGEGDIRVMTIDSLNLEACDLIQLDIEGYELAALQGAWQTIEKFHPVICVEEKGLGDKYGVKDGEIAAFLMQFGYVLQNKFNRDLIFAAKQ